MLKDGLVEGFHMFFIRLERFKYLSEAQIHLVRTVLTNGQSSTVDAHKLRTDLVDKQAWELIFSTELHRVLKVLVRLSRKSTNDVRGYRDARNFQPQDVDDLAEVVTRVLASHVGQDSVTAALDGHVKKLVDPRMVHDVRDLVQVVEDVGRIRHAESQTTIFWNDLDQFLQQIWQGDADIAAVGSSVLGGQPQFDHTLLETLQGKHQVLRNCQAFFGFLLFLSFLE